VALALCVKEICEVGDVDCLVGTAAGYEEVGLVT